MSLTDDDLKKLGLTRTELARLEGVFAEAQERPVPVFCLCCEALAATQGLVPDVVVEEDGEPGANLGKN